MAQLNIDNDKGLLFPAAAGTATGAIRLGDKYYEVSNSSTTLEGTANKKTLNLSFKQAGSKKGFEVHLTRSPFKAEKAPNFISQEFKLNNIDYQVVGWMLKSNATGRPLISLAVNEVHAYEFDL